MRKFLATVAIAALAVGTAQAQGKGNGGGQGNGGGGDHSGHVMSGPQQGGGKAAGGGNGNGGAKGGGQEMRSVAAPRAVERQDGNPGNGNAKARVEMPVRAQAPGNGAQNRIDHAAMQAKANGNNDKGDWRSVGNSPRGDYAVVSRDGNKVNRVAWQGIGDRFARGGLIDGCPPGLAKKNNGCLPPGQANKVPWQMDRDWWGIRSLPNLAGYSYYDGSMVRYGPSGAVVSYVPLLGGALAIGNMWPSAYAPTVVDPYYVNYYGLGDDYRYYDRAFYRVDPDTQAISAIAALLTGDDFAVGSRMPLGYDVYNVPYGYRDQYVDGPDSYYRYSDGYVYQVDPKTQLIMAAIQLLT